MNYIPQGSRFRKIQVYMLYSIHRLANTVSAFRLVSMYWGRICAFILFLIDIFIYRASLVCVPVCYVSVYLRMCVMNMCICLCVSCSYACMCAC